MPKARVWGTTPEEIAKGNVAIFCPGCNYHHVLSVSIPQQNGSRWGFNGDYERPTFTPSLLIRTGSFAQPGYIDPPEIPPSRCHSFITDGKIQFLSDSTHGLSGQTVDLPDLKFV